MNEITMSFGGYLTRLREGRGMTLRRMAQELEVSPPFISDVEKDRCAPLTADRIEAVSMILHLMPDEKTALYDLAGKQRDTVAPDLPEYIKGKAYVSVALRTARDLDADEADWLAFVERLKKKREG